MMILLLVTLFDGSSVNIKVPDSTVIEFKTSYGTLKVPAKELRELNMGIHVENPKEFEKGVENLGSETYAIRAAATKFLKDNPRGAYKYILPLKNSQNPEVKKRIESLLKEYKEIPPILDFLSFSKSYVSGEVQLAELEGESISLGKLKIKISQIKSIHVRNARNTVTVDTNADWMEIGQIFDGKISITAKGQVDIWPQGPGQYVTGPNGYTTVKDGFNSGALLGRASDGRVFLIGASYSRANLPRGPFEVKINGSPWNNQSSGTYEVTID